MKTKYAAPLKKKIDSATEFHLLKYDFVHLPDLNTRSSLLSPNETTISQLLAIQWLGI